MAMNGTTLGDAIYSAIQALNANQQKSPQAVWEAIAAVIVAHIKANAVVSVTVASVSGVTTGLSASGPGTGTGTIS